MQICQHLDRKFSDRKRIKNKVSILSSGLDRVES